MQDAEEKQSPKESVQILSGSRDSGLPIHRLYVYQPEMPENPGFRLTFIETNLRILPQTNQLVTELRLQSSAGTSIRNS